MEGSKLVVFFYYFCYSFVRHRSRAIAQAGVCSAINFVVIDTLQTKRAVNLEVQRFVFQCALETKEAFQRLSKFAALGRENASSTNKEDSFSFCENQR